MDFRPSRDDLWSRVETLGNSLDRLRKALKNLKLTPTILRAWKTKEQQLLRKLQAASNDYFEANHTGPAKDVGRDSKLEELGRKLDVIRGRRDQHPEGSEAYKTLNIIYQKLKREYDFLAAQSTNEMIETMRAAWKKMF